MTTVTEIGRDLFRISTYVAAADLQFNQFLIRDEEPLLFHTGMRSLFPTVREAVATVLDPSRIRWIAFSHFEADECGALNDWLAVAPGAAPACSFVGASVSVNDFALRPARALQDGEVLATGTHRFRFCRTPHLPHCWEAGLLFDESDGTLLCSDLFHQNGDVAAVTTEDVVGPFRATLTGYQAGPFANYLPYTPLTEQLLERLAALRPTRLATMHGATYVGDGARALRDLGTVLREVLATP